MRRTLLLLAIVTGAALLPNLRQRADAQTAETPTAPAPETGAETPPPDEQTTAQATDPTAPAAPPGTTPTAPPTDAEGTEPAATAPVTREEFEALQSQLAEQQAEIDLLEAELLDARLRAEALEDAATSLENLETDVSEGIAAAAQREANNQASINSIDQALDYLRYAEQQLAWGDTAADAGLARAQALLRGESAEAVATARAFIASGDLYRARLSAATAIDLATTARVTGNPTSGRAPR